MRWLTRSWLKLRERVTGRRLESTDLGVGPNGADRTFPLPLEKDAAQLEAALLTEQLRMLTDKRIDLWMNMLNALLVSWIVRSLLPVWLVLLWLTVFSIVILLRHLSRRRFHRGKYDFEAMRRWAIVFTCNGMVTGILWGLTACIVLVAPNPVYVVFITFVLGGMMAGGIVTNSAYLPAMYCFIIPTIIPVIVALISRQSMFNLPMAVMLTNFAIVLVLAGRSINRSIEDNVRLRVGQSFLTDQLLANEKIMAEVQRIAQVGGLEIVGGGQKISCTDEALRIIGVDRYTFNPSFATLIARVHPEDRVRVTDKFKSLIHAEDPNDIDCRIVMDNGDVKYVRLVGQIIEKSKTSPMRFFVAVQNVTVGKLEEDKLRFANLLLQTQMEASPDGILVVDENQSVIASNQLFAQIWNISAEMMAAGEDGPVLAAVTAAQKNPGPFGKRVEHLYQHPGEDSREELALTDGRCIDRYSKTLFAPTKEYLGRVWFFRDITERKRADEQLAYRDRLLHAVTEGTRILVKAESPDEAMGEALRVVCEGMGVDRVLVMQEFEDASLYPKLRYAWQRSPDKFDLDAYPLPPGDGVALGVWRAPLREGKAVIAQVETVEPAVKRMFEWFHNKSALMVPIFVGKQLWGTLAADSTSAVRHWTTTEIDTLKTFGDISGALMVHHEAELSLHTSEERFRVLGATAGDAIIMIDGAGRISSWNKAAENILGYTAQEAMGRDLHQLLAPDRYRALAVEAMKEFRVSGTGNAVGTTRELTARRKDGEEIAIELSLSGAHVNAEWQAIGIIRDVTERKAAERKLQLANIMLTTEMDASLDGILVVDTNRKILSSNRQLEEIWKTPRAILESGEASNVLAVCLKLVKNPERLSALVAGLYSGPTVTSDDEVELLDGRIIELHTVPLATESGTYLGRAWFFRDVTGRRQAEALAIRSAHFDVLTGLANRSVFVEAVDVAVARAKRGNHSFAVIYLDLDHFKDVNDTLGHPLGDSLLMEVAHRLLSNTRAVDTVARFGGDEFAIVLADIGAPADAATVAEKLIEALKVPYLIDGNQIYSSASIGIDIYGSDAAAAEVLLSHADVALYRAKQGGRNSYRFFTETMDREVRTQVSLGTELHDALERGEFFLEYQPQVAVADSLVVGVEALVRWRHPKRGILCPDIFIPIAEKTGLIIQIGKWVLLTACIQMKIWMDAGVKPIRIAVNMSAVQLTSATDLKDDIVQILKTTGVPARYLELELTETVLMAVTRENDETMKALRALGITVAIDDFGTGYSSLAYLSSLSVDRVKIDQHFVLHLGTHPGYASIVRATISLARELGIAVIAEGVETSEQLDLLSQWGCREVQGFYFAPPLAIAEITHLLLAGGSITPQAALKD